MTLIEIYRLVSRQGISQEQRQEIENIIKEMGLRPYIHISDKVLRDLDTRLRETYNFGII